MTARSQWVQAPWMILGWVLLIPFCLARAWKPCMSTINPYGREPREIDEWAWAWLNTVYGNYEDGVSGEKALIWYGPLRALYRPSTWPPLRAYLWSAWRNSTNALNR